MNCKHEVAYQNYEPVNGRWQHVTRCGGCNILLELKEQIGVKKVQKYVLGFLFNLKRNHVLLIEKLKPEWQKGKLNGIGGKIEEGEFPHEAMQREFKEECGLEYGNWREVCTMHRKTEESWCCYVFCGFSNVIWEAETKTEEEICRYSVRGLPSHCLPNLHWLIPMCLDVEILDQVYTITNEV